MPILGVRRVIGAKTSTLIPNWNSKKVAEQGVYIAGIKLDPKDGLSISCRKDEQAKKLFDFLQFLGLKSLSLDSNFKHADKEYGSFNGQVKIKNDIEIFCYVIAVCEFTYQDVQDLYEVSNMTKEYQNIIQYKNDIENYIDIFKTDHLNNFPEELIALIKESLSFKDKIQLSMVNKKFNQYLIEGEFQTENAIHLFESILRTANLFLSEEIKPLEDPNAPKKVILYRPNGQGILCQAYIVPNTDDETNNKLFVNKDFLLTKEKLEAIEKFCKKHNLLKSHYYRYDITDYSLFDKDNDNTKPEYNYFHAKYQVITAQEELEFLQTANKIKEAIDNIYTGNSIKKSVGFFNSNNNNEPSKIHVAYEQFKRGFTMAIHKKALIDNLNVFISVLQNEKDPSAKSLLTECENHYQQLKSPIPAQPSLGN